MKTVLTCESCLCWDEDHQIEGAISREDGKPVPVRDNFASCTRYPPKPFVTAQGQVGCIYPATHRNWFCDEYIAPTAKKEGNN